ncbi:MAG: response regulator [Patescibacteria group bacterium]|jgi:CheY-like chemotaxis protein
MTTKPKVLLIDDDHSLIHMYTLKFTLDDTYELLTADTPERGLEIARDASPDIILLDLVLPKSAQSFGNLNKEIGFHVLEELKKDEKTKDIPVVILTNLDEKTQGNVERAKELGAIDYWVKAHYQPAEVIEKVRQLVKK